MYFNFFLMTGDKHAANDIKAMAKGKAIKESDRVLACSILLSGGQIYLSGIVAAAMKKSVSFHYICI